MSEAQQYCTFHLGDYLMGVEVYRVQEIIRYQEITRVPLASKALTGLINLRGQIVTAIDLRHRLQFEDRPEDVLPINVVIRSDESVISLLVDEIGDVLEVDDQNLEELPATTSGIARELISSVL